MRNTQRIQKQGIILSLIGGILFLSLIIVPVNSDDVQGTDFTANITSGAPPLTVLFTDISSLPVIEGYRKWTFGDGTETIDPIGNIAHTYTIEGIYDVQLDRIDSEGFHSLIKYAYITVVVPTPTPTITPETTVTTPITTIITTTPTTTIPTTSPTTSPTTAPTTAPTPKPTVQIPSEFYGQALYSSNPVPVDSSVVARIGERNAGEVIVATPGIYGGPGPFDERLKVYATLDEMSAGQVFITFWLNGTIPAGQTALYQSGSAQNLTLLFGSVTPTPTQTQTTVPTTTPVTTATTQTPTPTQTIWPPTTPVTTVTTPIPTTTTITPTVSPTGTQGLTLTFEPGWNFISIPRVLATGADTGAIFSSIDMAGHSMWRYNSTAQLFDRIYPATRLNPTDGIWLYSAQKTPLQLHFAGSQGIVERALFSGWNGFGIISIPGTPARDALVPVENSWEYLYGFDPLNQTYEISIVRNGAGSHSDLRHMYPGNGYWLYMIKNTTFEGIMPDV